MLLSDIPVQLNEVHLLEVLLDEIKISRLHGQRRIHHLALHQLLFRNEIMLHIVVDAPPVIQGVINDFIRTKFIFKFMIIKLFQCEFITSHALHIVARHIGVRPFFYLHMDVRARALHQVLHVLVFERPAYSIHPWNHEVAKVKRDAGKQQSCHNIWPQQPPETDAATEYRYDFGMSRHLRSEENHRDKREQVNEQINNIVNKANEGKTKKEYSFNGFVISACEYALKHMK